MGAGDGRASILLCAWGHSAPCGGPLAFLPLTGPNQAHSGGRPWPASCFSTTDRRITLGNGTTTTGGSGTGSLACCKRPEPSRSWPIARRTGPARTRPPCWTFAPLRTQDGLSPPTPSRRSFRRSGQPARIIPECSWSNARRSRLSRSGLDGTVAPTRAWPRLASGWRGNVEMSKVSTCLWFGKDAEAAVRFYVTLVPDSCLEHIQRAPSAWPGGEAGDVILVTFNLAGQSFQALNGGTPADYGTAASISVRCARIRRRSIGCGQPSPPTAGRKSCAAGFATGGRTLANCARRSAASSSRLRPCRLWPRLRRDAEHGQVGHRDFGTCSRGMTPRLTACSGYSASPVSPSSCSFSPAGRRCSSVEKSKEPWATSCRFSTTLALTIA